MRCICSCSSCSVLVHKDQQKGTRIGGNRHFGVQPSIPGSRCAEAGRWPCTEGHLLGEQHLALLESQVMRQNDTKSWKRVLVAVALISVICLSLLRRSPRAGRMVSQHIKLNTGALIPSIGLGVFLATPGREAISAVASALHLGYRQTPSSMNYLATTTRRIVLLHKALP